MCSMCHYCGARITDSDGKKLENGSSFKVDAAGPMCLCKVCKENQEREMMKPDSKSTSESPMLSPMPSLSSINSWVSCYIDIILLSRASILFCFAPQIPILMI